jgi:acetolactate synthase-1/2/3 large subunit
VTNADLLVQMLREAGVSHGFGIPSGNVLPLLEAMRTGGLPFVLTAHEGSAAFAADVMGRVNGGAPGFCLATLGPGATNLATGVGCAYLDRSPLIAVTCNLPTTQLGRRLQMSIDHHALFRAITKATLALRQGRVAAVVAEALDIALSEPPGPVHLDLPEDVAVAPATEPVPPAPTGRPLAPADEPSLRRAVELLAAARRPVAVVGASAVRARPELVRAVVERHGLPFATTTMAKGVIDEQHPLAIGCIERACRQVQREFLRGCDLVLALGYDVVEVEYEAWIGQVPLLAVDVEAVDADASVVVAHQVVGDLDRSLEYLARAEPADHGWPPEAAEQQRARFERALRPRAAGFTPHQAIDVVRAVLPASGALAFDVGAHTHQIAGQWAARDPRTFLITNGWSSMGFGLPAAIAACLARPERPVVALIGDGCFQMTCGEVAVAGRLGLRLPIVVLDDGWLSLIQVKQHRRGLAVYGTDVPRAEEAPPHYFGVPAVTVRNAEDLAKALTAALHAEHPTVIEATVDPAHYLQTVYD